jgi:hypothetical protein
VSELAAGVVVLLREDSVEDWYVDDVCAGGVVDSAVLLDADVELVELEAYELSVEVVAGADVVAEDV